MTTKRTITTKGDGKTVQVQAGSSVRIERGMVNPYLKRQILEAQKAAEELGGLEAAAKGPEDFVPGLDGVSHLAQIIHSACDLRESSNQLCGRLSSLLHRLGRPMPAVDWSNPEGDVPDGQLRQIDHLVAHTREVVTAMHVLFDELERGVG